MSNMSYCTFENTNKDLEDCINTLETDGVAHVYEDASAQEKRGMRLLFDNARYLIDNFGDDIAEVLGE